MKGETCDAEFAKGRTLIFYDLFSDRGKIKKCFYVNAKEIL